MVKTTVDFFLSSGLPLTPHVGRDYINIEIGGRGFDLKLVSGAQKPLKIWLQRLGPVRPKLVRYVCS